MSETLVRRPFWGPSDIDCSVCRRCVRKRGLHARDSAIESNFEGDLPHANKVAVNQYCFARRLATADLVSVDESSVLATQITNSQSELIEQEDTMMTAEERVFVPQMTIDFAAYQEFALGNLDRLRDQFTDQYPQARIHVAAPFALRSVQQGKKARLGRSPGANLMPRGISGKGPTLVA
jgi:hypothetical protein